MKEPTWISFEVCFATHTLAISRFGGLGGLRDRGLLDTALHRPKQIFAYADHPTIFELAAAYASGIVRNHPFLDGNKRTGFLLAGLFIERNGYFLQASEIEAVERTFALAASAISEEEYAQWLKKISVSTNTSNDSFIE